MGSFAASPEGARFSAAGATAFFRVEGEDFFGAVSEGLSELPSIFFRLPRIEVEGFLAMGWDGLCHASGTDGRRSSAATA